MKLKLEAVEKEIIEKYLKGKSVAEIAKDYKSYEQPVINLLKKSKIYKPKERYKLNSFYFNKINTGNKAYILGFITADGCINGNSGKSKYLTFSIRDYDKEILDFIKKELETEAPIQNLKQEQIRLNICNEQIITDLIHFGLTERKSLTVPNLLRNIPEEFKADFIRGYFDGDGCITFKKDCNTKYVSFVGTKELLSAFREFLGIKRELIKYKNIYRLVFGHKNDIQNFFNVIYKKDSFYLKRKYLRFLM